jgi:Outer membrane protein beta-barrel domain
MKKIFTIIAMLALANLGLAQEEGGPDTTRFKVGSMEFIIIDNDTTLIDVDDTDPDVDRKDTEITYKPGDLTYWGGIDVGVNILMNNQFQSSFAEEHLIMDPAKSFSYSFNFFEKRLKFGTEHVGLVTGLGFTNSRFGFSNDRLRLDSNADSTFGVVDSSLTNGFNLNQLRVSYFNIPVLLHFNTSKNHKKNFHISLGIIGGVRIGSKMKYKYDVLGGESKDKTSARYNLNAFQASLTARMGYRNFGVFANFDMLPLFQNGTSTVAKPLTFGASFNF